MKKLLSVVQYFYCEFSLSAGSFPSIPLVSRQYNFDDFLHIKILEKSKRSSYQSVINSVSCIKPFDNFDFVYRVLFSHVFLLQVVEQGPPRHLQHAGICEVQREMHQVANSGQRTANLTTFLRVGISKKKK